MTTKFSFNKHAWVKKPHDDGWVPPMPPRGKGHARYSFETYEKIRAEQVCIVCKRHRTPEGHDPCIADLPGVEFGCCGHGIKDGYVKFEDGTVLRGMFDGMPGAKFDGTLK